MHNYRQCPIKFHIGPIQRLPPRPPPHSQSLAAHTSAALPNPLLMMGCATGLWVFLKL